MTRFFEGETFAELVRAAPEPRRRRAGEAILRYAIESTIVDRVINTDMHPGNLLFSEERVCVLDFGNVRAWEGEGASGWRDILEGALAGDRARVLAGHERLGFVPGGPRRTYEKMAARAGGPARRRGARDPAGAGLRVPAVLGPARDPRRSRRADRVPPREPRGARAHDCGVVKSMSSSIVSSSFEPT